MKNCFIVLLMSVIMALPMGGCATFGGNWQNNVSQQKADIFMFSKIATRVALSEVKIQTEDVKLIEGYLVALRDLLAVPGHPNFLSARFLVYAELPSKYQVYGLTIIDVLERYLKTMDFNITEDQEIIIMLISSGIDGAIEAVKEFSLE